jgi:hypothetical protein
MTTSAPSCVETQWRANPESPPVISATDRAACVNPYIRRPNIGACSRSDSIPGFRGAVRKFGRGTALASLHGLFRRLLGRVALADAVDFGLMLRSSLAVFSASRLNDLAFA